MYKSWLIILTFSGRIDVRLEPLVSKGTLDLARVEVDFGTCEEGLALVGMTEPSQWFLRSISPFARGVNECPGEIDGLWL